VVAGALAALEDLPAVVTTADALSTSAGPLAGDPLLGFWQGMLTSRRATVGGARVEAAVLLAELSAMRPLPEHLHRTLVMDQVWQELGTSGSGSDTLGARTALLAGMGAHAEAALVAGLRADLLGDLGKAERFYRAAVHHGALGLPSTLPVALVCRAQVLDAQGRGAEAMESLEHAVSCTAPRRSAQAFRGWSRSGTALAPLLSRLRDADGAGWAAELQQAGHGVSGPNGFLTADPGGGYPISPSGPPAVTVRLSAREREVLDELARGSTYADIAANLFISKNTVKTHVSALYTKLEVGSRSDALRSARLKHLL
jgi:DNA-binding CsgD family transcriptional regulator